MKHCAYRYCKWWNKNKEIYIFACLIFYWWRTCFFILITTSFIFLRFMNTYFKRSFIKRQASGTTSDNEWHNEWQRMTTSGTTRDNEWQRVTTSGTTSDNERQRVTTSGTTSDNEWQRVVQRMTTSDRKVDSKGIATFSNLH